MSRTYGDIISLAIEANETGRNGACTVLLKEFLEILRASQTGFLPFISPEDSHLKRVNEKLISSAQEKACKAIEMVKEVEDFSPSIA